MASSPTIQRSTPQPGYRTEPGKDKQGRSGTWHIYPDGKRVFVAAAVQSVPGRGTNPNLEAWSKEQRAGQPAAAAPGGAPAPERERTKPFLTPGEFLADAMAKASNATSRADIEGSKRDAQTQHQYGLGEVNDAARRSAYATQNDAAARGIFQSSVKDAAVYDIEAQRAMNQSRLNDELGNITTTADLKLKAIGDAETAAAVWREQQAGQNAQQVEASIIPEAPAAAAPAAAAPAAPSPEGFKREPAYGGAWHVYPDGRRVFVKSKITAWGR